MAEVFAGFVAGYLVALISTPLLAAMLLRLRSSSESLSRLLPAEAPVISIGMILHGGLFLFWTGIGLVLGMLLLAMPENQDALASRSIPFSFMVVSLVIAIFAPVLIFFRSLRLPGFITAFTVIAIFGWLMPHMATWTRFD